MERLLSICLVSREYPPFFGGGIGSYTVRWSRVLAAAGHRVTIITVADDGGIHQERDGAITVVRLPLVRGGDWSRPDPALDSVWTRAAFNTFSPVAVFAMQIAEHLPRLHADRAFDIVEAPDTGALAWFALNDRRTGPGYRDHAPAFVTCIHSPTEWIARWNRIPLQGRQDAELAAMEADQARWSDALVCPSSALATEAADLWCPATPIEVIPYPLGELEQIGGKDPARTGSGAAESPGSSSLRLLYTGRLEPRKGVDTLLEAIGISLRTNPTLEIDLAGEDLHHSETSGPFGQAMLERHIPNHHHARVRLRGKLDEDTVAYLQQRADAIVLPSPMDNFPNTCIEAMARGKVVIAGNAGGMADMIRHRSSGLLTEPGNAESLARVINEVAEMTTDERTAIARDASSRIRELCGNQRVLHARLDHYRRAIEHRREHVSRLREGRRSVIVVNAASATPEQIEELQAPVADAGRGIDFVHAWLERSDQAMVFGTPSLDSLGTIEPEIGPLAVAADALTPEARKLISRADGGHRATAKSTWAIAAVLAAAGRTGAVLPSVRIRHHRERFRDRPSPDERLAKAEADLAATRAELGRIYKSRGWRILQHCYAVLHVLKGRGRRKGGYNSSSPSRTFADGQEPRA